MKPSKRSVPDRTAAREEALQAVPSKHRLITESRLESGEVVITYPVALRPWMARIFAYLGKTSAEPLTRRLQLDTLGTAVWDLIDGQRSVSRIIEQFAHLYQLQFREAEMSVTQFLRELGRRGIIGMR